ncbi:chorismate-binding protein [uncultured Polaribacter sp.]|uniref:chorismate-binding protein n=1 Tax=uncultured Polaribacter sp. TaxID=174711 RepID=UPI00260622BB|nr:chorismate-binding protein [uncultured Polaribacter sp.]
MNSLLPKIAQHYQNKLPFVAYRKPNKKEVSGIFMQDDILKFIHNFKEQGFVFAPFTKEEKAVFFPIKNALRISEKLALEQEFYKNTNSISAKGNKVKHISIVEKAIDTIKNSLLQKVVISREEIVNLSEVAVVEIYKRLLATYTNAFVYVWYHPKVGLWFGATPETLLFTKGNTFKTMSLAGTQLYNSNESIQRTIWKSKELEEQQLVTDFIENQLKDIGKELHVDKTETVRAGNLLHLKTKVTGVLKENSNLETLIRALHPTPAVCGLPRDLANDFIVNNENYKRTFYTGFLGELNLNSSNSETKNSQLFVNLRCMRIENQKATIYVGGGITKDSNAAKEWEETVSKALTMKQVL